VLLAGAASAQPRQLQVPVSTAQVVTFRAPARSVFIADPTIADVQVASPTSVIVFGRKPGQTTLIAMGGDDKPLANIDVRVAHSYSDLRRLVLQEVSAPGVKITPTPTGIILSGSVASNELAEKVAAAAQRFAPENATVVNNLEVAGPAQVNLRVRVAEVQRSLTKQLGFNWDAVGFPGAFALGIATGRTISGIPGLITRALPLTSTSATPAAAALGVSTNRLSIAGVIDALAEEGLITILAQPNLTAISGQPANFLAGGEFPVPVAQNSGNGGLSTTITIQFKEFGVKLAFVPTVLSNDRIAIKVRPEVSELSTQGAITIGDLTIPALSTRRAETTVELGSGESFAIAGLIQDNISTDINKFPWLGNIPILGALFRSSRFQRQETELVIIVTPYVVRPVAEGPSLKLPTDGLQPASDVEQILFDRLVKPSDVAAAIAASGARLRGDVGFIFE
jgi:pilus assembly protein CpaC